MKSRRILVIGGDGTIGSALVSEWGGDFEVWKTSRRTEAKKLPRTRFLDLTDPDLSALDGEWEAAVVCAGAVRVQMCHTDPVGTRLVNVENLSRVVKALTDRGVYVLALSTNQVFSGELPFVPEDGQRNPITEYGRQKSAAEERFEMIGLHSLGILRLTKVFEPAPALLQGWVNAWSADEVIRPFSNMQVSPVSLRETVQVIKRLVAQKAPRIWHFGGASEISYAHLAILGADNLGFSRHLVNPQTTEDAAYIEYVPRHSTLSSERLLRELSIRPPNVEELATEIFSNLSQDRTL